ncbi:MAG TPA: hypothetical protein VKA97_10690 [Pyrinomonadaceae bacterium]|nr:hypothetical protein [Pyrinomonadaceae bacterium]
MTQQTQESLSSGGNGSFSTTTGYATGTICQSSGTFRASNKYMDAVLVYAAGEVFLPFVDGKKTTWYALSPSLSTNEDGSFTSVKVVAGSV